MNALTPTNTAKLLPSLPGPMLQAVAEGLSAGLAALDNDMLHRETVPVAVVHSLRLRRQELMAALAPAPRPFILKVLASLNGMAARGVASEAESLAMARQDAEDLSDVAPWALEAAARAFRRGEIGDGKWRPTAGELRKEARRREDEPRAELFRIGRLLDAPTLERPKPVMIDKARMDGLSAEVHKFGKAD